MRAGFRHRTLLLLCALALAVALRAPQVGAHSRYFYHEDDAHHFNRTVEMAQRFELNPHYFNKPALHFYLRMPVVWASVAWARRSGELGSLKEIRTRDPYGLGGFAFSASHPSVLAWNRWFSVIMSLGIVALTFSLALRLTLPNWAALLAATLVAVSPEVLVNSDIIGVDIPMALFCVLSTLLGVRFVSEDGSRAKLLACGITAGLAGATKYNAAPIALVPLLAACLRNRSFATIALAILAPAAGYLLGAPYSILAFREFWDGLSYEVWHYSVSGHEGHSATPGIEQALFYLSWLVSDGVGLTATLLAAVGAATCLRMRSPARLVFLVFPVAYAALMVAQKTNFTRNMVPVVPYVAIAAALGLCRIARFIHSEPLRVLAASLLTLAATCQPTVKSVGITLREVLQPESRNTLLAWVEQNGSGEEIAIAGAIQAPPALWRKPGVAVFDSATTPLPTLIQQGYTLVALPAADAAAVTLPFSVDLALPGNPIDKHSPKNPAITVLRVTDEALAAARAIAPAQLTLKPSGSQLTPDCGQRDETHCWLQARETTLVFPRGTSELNLQCMSPWPNQEISVRSLDGSQLATLKLRRPGEWATLHAQLPPSQDSLVIAVKIIHAPDDQGLSADPRRLGAALR